MNALISRIGRLFQAWFPMPGTEMVVVYIVSVGEVEAELPRHLTAKGKQQAEAAAAAITRMVKGKRMAVLSPDASSLVVPISVKQTIEIFSRAGAMVFQLYGQALTNLFRKSNGTPPEWLARFVSYRARLGLKKGERLNLVLVDHQRSLEQHAPGKCPPGSIRELTISYDPQSGHIEWRRFH